MKKITTILVLVLMSSTVFADKNDIESAPGISLTRRLNKMLAVSYVAGMKKTTTSEIIKQFPEINFQSDAIVGITLSNNNEYCNVFLEDLEITSAKCVVDNPHR